MCFREIAHGRHSPMPFNGWHGTESSRWFPASVSFTLCKQMGRVPFMLVPFTIFHPFLCSETVMFSVQEKKERLKRANERKRARSAEFAHNGTIQSSESVACVRTVRFRWRHTFSNFEFGGEMGDASIRAAGQCWAAVIRRQTWVCEIEWSWDFWYIFFIWYAQRTVTVDEYVECGN